MTSKNKFAATHPHTGEVVTRGTTHEYTHAVWISVPEQTYEWPAYRTKATRRFYAHDVAAGSRTIAAESGILSFHASEALARKAMNAWLAQGARSTWTADAGIVPTTKLN